METFLWKLLSFSIGNEIWWRAPWLGEQCLRSTDYSPAFIYEDANQLVGYETWCKRWHQTSLRSGFFGGPSRSLTSYKTDPSVQIIWVWRCLGSSYNNELQLSNLHVMKTWTRAFVLFYTKKSSGIRAIFLIWKNDDLQMDATCFSRLIFSSIVTPMLQAASVRDPFSDPKVSKSNCGLGRCWDPITISSVLSLFSSIHSSISPTHCVGDDAWIV